MVEFNREYMMNMATLKTFAAGLALASFSALPALAAGPEAPVKQVGLFAKKVEDCAKDAKKVAKKKSNGKHGNGDDGKKAGCDGDNNGKKAGCDGDGGGCNLLQRAMNKSGIGRRLSDAGVKAGGFLQMGYHSDNNGLFNNHADDFNVHQLYFSLEKVADDSEGMGIGFRSDIVYGVDAQDLQAFGNDRANEYDDDDDFDHGDYGWALPQMYATVVRDDLSVKLGHFNANLGMESNNPTQNFFYSHSKAMYNSQPRTLTGLMADYSLTDELTTSFGWAGGWNSGMFERGNTRTGTDGRDGSALVSTIGFNPLDGVSLTYAVSMGDLGERGEGYVHSIFGELEIIDDITYAIESVFVDLNQETAYGAGADGPGGANSIGITQYLTSKINDKLSAGARVEWWKNSGDSEYNVTFGLNYQARDCIVVRPEVRTDWGADAQGVRAATNADDQTVFGIDVILSY